MLATCQMNGAEVVIEQSPSGSILLKGLDYKSIKSGLKIIAQKQGIQIDGSWNTRYLGRHIIKALNGERSAKNLISRERRLVGQFLSEDDNGDVEITHENVAKVEAMISYDSKYTRSGDKESGPDDKWKEAFDSVPLWTPFHEYEGYRGSTAFWISKLKDFYFGKTPFQDINKSEDDVYSLIIFNAVCAIDSENSTHINADGVGRNELANRIISHRDDLIQLLKNDNKNYELIQILSLSTTPKSPEIDKETGKEKKYYSRNNFSFATKFCHYACMYLFDQECSEYQDSYSIYDDILATALKKRYGYKLTIPILENGDKDYASSYKSYQQYIDARIKEAGEEVSRNGFDHLFWYFYKGIGKKAINKE